MLAPVIHRSLDEERRFRAAAGHLPAGVFVILTLLDGAPHGTTATSAVLVSFAPPLVAVFVACHGRTHDRIVAVGAFTLNLLRREDHALARRFANPTRATGRAGFSGIDLLPRDSGPPVLAGAAAWFACRVHDVVPMGDHAGIVGEVTDCARDPDAAPLLAHRGRLHGLGRPVQPPAWMTPADADLAAAW